MTKSTHGGKRPGAGRPPRKDGRKSRNIRIWLTEAEYHEILAETTPDTRRKILLGYTLEELYRKALTN